eukprot:g74350.t1
MEAEAIRKSVQPNNSLVYGADDGELIGYLGQNNELHNISPVRPFSPPPGGDDPLPARGGKGPTLTEKLSTTAKSALDAALASSKEGKKTDERVIFLNELTEGEKKEKTEGEKKEEGEKTPKQDKGDRADEKEEEITDEARKLKEKTEGEKKDEDKPPKTSAPSSPTPPLPDCDAVKEGFSQDRLFFTVMSGEQYQFWDDKGNEISSCKGSTIFSKDKTGMKNIGVLLSRM